MTKQELKEYKEFMYDKRNVKNCASCPENEDRKGIDILPCGQYHCWVSQHCKGYK